MPFLTPSSWVFNPYTHVKGNILFGGPGPFKRDQAAVANGVPGLRK
jgi:hypothetical protein